MRSFYVRSELSKREMQTRGWTLNPGDVWRKTFTTDEEGLADIESFSGLITLERIVKARRPKNDGR